MFYYSKTLALFYEYQGFFCLEQAPSQTQTVFQARNPELHRRSVLYTQTTQILNSNCFQESQEYLLMG